jgi:hypothetical protein
MRRGGPGRQRVSGKTAVQTHWNRPIVQYSYLFCVVDRVDPFTLSGTLSSCTVMASTRNAAGIPSVLESLPVPAFVVSPSSSRRRRT